MEEQPSKVRINIVVDPHRFDEVMQTLSAMGVEVEHEQRAIGTVDGQVASDQVDTVEELEGVLAVERDETVQLPPPESDLQ